MSLFSLIYRKVSSFLGDPLAAVDASAKKTTKAKKKVKKSEKKEPDVSSIFDDGPSIFDDPLSAP